MYALISSFQTPFAVELELSVFLLCLSNDRQVRVGVLPLGEEALIRCRRLRLVSGHEIIEATLEAMYGKNGLLDKE